MFKPGTLADGAAGALSACFVHLNRRKKISATQSQREPERKAARLPPVILRRHSPAGARGFRPGFILSA